MADHQQTTEDATDHWWGAMPDDLRERGWSVAVHNDYRQHGECCTFWLLTHPNGRWVKGEGRTDAAALNQCREQIERRSMDGRLLGPFATRIEDNGTNGWLSLGFETYDDAQKFWRWAEKELENARRSF